jgi:precorrin-8X/cobalt-precorrin-8 methylmutase
VGLRISVQYLKDPEEIYRASFTAIRDAVDLNDIPETLQPLVIRLVHACGRPEITAALRWSGDPLSAAQEALGNGAPILVDANMVAAGIMRAGLPKENEVICTIADQRTYADAKRLATTRSSAAVDLWMPSLAGAVIAIGNAPTALFRLLELLAQPQTPRPAALFAFPVGFIGAAESKRALIESGLDIPYMTLTGREGGSAFAAAAINAVTRGAG